MRALAIIVAISACDPLPVMQDAPVETLQAWQLPACLFWCTLHLSLIRDETLAGAGATVTGGSNATSNTSGGGSLDASGN